MTGGDVGVKIQVLIADWECPVGTIQSDITNYEKGYGGAGFVPPEHVIHVELNMGHPGVRAAILSGDDDVVRRYIALLCGIRVWQYQKETGNYPWPHQDWPEFLLTCRELGGELDLDSMERVQ